jgi:Ni/Fe-hydrogenase subunit HybB-like protein
MMNRTRSLKDILWVLALAGLVAGVFRLWFGLGATTNLTDAVPWGLWKILNMVAGVAISTSGFTIGFLVYVLKLERFRPLMKPAILVAFLGYGCSCLALLFDIGLPFRFWHPFFMWNEHSFLFEVFWCVSLYFTITAIELAPTVFEKLRAERITAILHRIAFGVVVVGISLSSLHHSSLGSLFLVTPQRLHPLWYSSLLPLFFIISAIGAGMMFMVLIKIFYARLYDRESVFGPKVEETIVIVPLSGGANGNGRVRQPGRDMPMLVSLASIATVILGLFGILQIADLLLSGSWRALAAGTWESWLYGLEMTLLVALPLILVWNPRTRRSPAALGLAALSATSGLMLNRLDVGIFGYFRSAGEIYFPSLAEWALSIGVVAAAGLVFLFFIENFSIFDEEWKTRRADLGIFKAGFDSFTRVWNSALSSGPERATVIAVLVLPVAWALMYPPWSQGDAAQVEPALGLDVTRSVLMIDGDQSGVHTSFPHKEHQDRLGGENSCRTCHHMSLPGDRTTACFHCHRRMVEPTSIFDHDAHTVAVARKENLGGVHPSNHTCVKCHRAGEGKSAESSVPCLECHREDAQWEEPASEDGDLATAISYMEAMHQKCLACHREEAAQATEARLQALGDCSTCHRSLAVRGAEAVTIASGR